ncbi:MAG TPA: metal-dependent hydrolase [Nitrospiria bacterium]|nr:metal-dependent hydrolase [Nitrospiria bacterium]
MDTITHTLVGVGIANAFFRRRIGPSAVTTLALASNLPDIDAIVHLTGDPAAILLRRTFGHSLFLLPFWSLALAAILKRFYPSIKIYILFGLIFLGASLHLFFDLVNSFGVVLLWPFSSWRPELAIIFIIDLILTGLLAFPLLLYLIPFMRQQLELLSRIAMVCSLVYVIFCGTNRIMARQALATEIDYQRNIPELVYVFPEPLGPHRWRGVMRYGDTYKVYLIYSLSGRIELKDEVQTKAGDSIVERVRSIPLAIRLERFFKAPVWGTKRGSPTEVNVYDLRFRSIVIGLETPFEYKFRVYEDSRVELIGK